ncbi:hypothetical protein FBQ82_20960, partial [Anaerolineae bacterium CFX7]|nr:hypothetical protein [Anaerolineae bacterium CFX7]
MDYLTRLAAAQSAEERTWIITESLIGSLADDLRAAVWAAAIPHWFDEKILAALRPELAEHAARLYADLQTLPFVEVFQGRGHNIHELTRKVMLDHLWEENKEEYRILASRALEYFSGDEPEVQLERMYHRIVAEVKEAGEVLWNYSSTFNSAFRFIDSEKAKNVLLEHSIAGRTSNSLKANTLRAIGDIYFLHDERDNANASYLESLEIFKSIGDELGQTGVLWMLGKICFVRYDLTNALAYFLQALDLSRDVGDRLGEANTLRAIGDVQQFRKE